MYEDFQKYDVFQAIADPTRRKLLEMLAGKELSISTVSSYFTMSRTAVTKHLHILDSAELVHSRKVGRERLYGLNAEPFKKFEQWLAFYEPYWEDKLTELKSIVENEVDRK